MKWVHGQTLKLLSCAADLLSGYSSVDGVHMRREGKGRKSVDFFLAVSKLFKTIKIIFFMW